MENLTPYVWSIVAVVAAAAILLAVASVVMKRRHRSEELQILFGPEYDRAVRLYGDKERAERALESRRRRLSEFGVHELDEGQREHYLNEWRVIERGTSIDPAATLVRADQLLTEIMRAEGCPADDPAERKVDLALTHPTVAEDYRLASDTVERQRLGQATVDECRSAVLRYSNIFGSILGGADLRERLRKVS
jgi:hypothetical protein